MIKRGLKLDIVAEDKGVLNKLSSKVICIMSRKKTAWIQAVNQRVAVKNFTDIFAGEISSCHIHQITSRSGAFFIIYINIDNRHPLLYLSCH
jgi:Na+-transporting NADH:ubiquinone oxidoreductase subunit NqrA